MRIKSILWNTITRSLKDDIVIYGGYAAYTSLLAFFPFIIFLMAVASMFGSGEASGHIIQYGMSYLPPQIMDAIAPVIRSIMDNQHPGLLTIGGIATLWVASSGVEGLRFGLNKAYEVSEFRPVVRRRLEGLGVVIAASVALLLLVLGIIAWPLLIGLISRLLHIDLEGITGLAVVRYLLAALIILGLLAALYRLLPNYRQGWRNVWPGALLATFLWLALAQLFALYLEHFANYNATYGSIGGIIMTLVFFQYSATVFLFGAELNHMIETEKDTKTK